MTDAETMAQWRAEAGHGDLPQILRAVAIYKGARVVYPRREREKVEAVYICTHPRCQANSRGFKDEDNWQRHIHSKHPRWHPHFGWNLQ